MTRNSGTSVASIIKGDSQWPLNEFGFASFTVWYEDCGIFGQSGN